MRCPFCELDASRRDIHAHLLDAHPERVEAWTDAASGRMRYRIACPVCGEAHEHRVKPRWSDPGFLDAFGQEIRMVAFDMLLSHVEAEHGEGAPADAPAPPPTGLPAAGPAGGTGRPGAEGVPLPPGMSEPEPGPLERARTGRPALKIVEDPGRAPAGPTRDRKEDAP